MVGGGLGRTPFLAKTIKPFLPKRDVLSYVEAMLRLYNQYGRRDNIYKARIKILVHDMGAEQFAKEVEAEWQNDQGRRAGARSGGHRRHRGALSAIPDYEPLADNPPELQAARKSDARFAAWLDNSVTNHKQPGLCHRDAVAQADRQARRATAPRTRWTRSPISRTATASAKSASATNRIWCCRMSRSAICRRCCARSTRIGVATPNVNLVSDIIACPGLDYCSLANARSIPVAQEISKRFRDLDARATSLGRLHINISGCINACGHHHVGHIGILGVEKNGEEFYQITIGGRADEQAAARHADRSGGALRRRRRRGRGYRRGLSRRCASGRTNCSSTPSSASVSSLSRSASMPLVKGGTIVADRFVRVEDGAPVPDQGAVIVSAARFLRRCRRARRSAAIRSA